MQRTQPSSRVRRRLFSEDDVTHQAKIDNFANCITERIFYDKDASSKKWNFDFENEVPLEGTYEWERCDDSNQWIGTVRQQTETNINTNDISDDEEMAKDSDKLMSIRDENEVTPRQKDDDATMPLVRKRRQDEIASIDKGVRRKISFD